MPGQDHPLLVTGGAAAEQAQLVQDLRQLGHPLVLSAADPDVALGLLLTTDPQVQTLLCLLDNPSFDSIDFLQHALESPATVSLLLLHAHSDGELGPAAELAARYDTKLLGALPLPLDLVRLEELLRHRAGAPLPFAAAPSPQLGLVELRNAIEENADLPQLVLHYQPKVELKSGAIVGVEVLARWQHPEHGLLGPESFLQQAAQGGLLQTVSRSICQRAIAQTAAWQRLGVTLRTSVNVPLETFLSPDFSGFLADLCHQQQLPAHQLSLEVTETQVVNSTTDCIDVLNLLREQHIGLSIDDFGLGNTSLHQLQLVPFNELKIDRRLANGAARNPNQRALVEASIELARQLGMSVVAVGIEDREDWDSVADLGCDMVQGYYCSPPLPPEELITFFHRWQGPRHDR